MTVELTPELERLVEAKVESGTYGSANEVVGEALRLLEARDEELLWGREEIRARIQRGLEESARGEWVDGETFMQEMLEGLAARKRELARRGKGE
jgi:antitoxin ParD1/3/4